MISSGNTEKKIMVNMSAMSVPHTSILRTDKTEAPGLQGSLSTSQQHQPSSAPRVLPLLYIQSSPPVRINSSSAATSAITGTVAAQAVTSTMRPTIVTSNGHQFIPATLGGKPSGGSKPMNAQPHFLIQASRPGAQVPVSVTANNKHTITYFSTILKQPGVGVSKAGDGTQLVLPTGQLQSNILPGSNQKLVLAPLPVLPAQASGPGCAAQPGKLTSVLMPVSIAPQVGAAKANMINLKIANGQIHHEGKGPVTVLRETKPLSGPGNAAVPPLQPLGKFQSKVKCVNTNGMIISSESAMASVPLGQFTHLVPIAPKRYGSEDDESKVSAASCDAVDGESARDEEDQIEERRKRSQDRLHEALAAVLSSSSSAPSQAVPTQAGASPLPALRPCASPTPVETDISSVLHINTISLRADGSSLVPGQEDESSSHSSVVVDAVQKLPDKEEDKDVCTSGKAVSSERKESSGSDSDGDKCVIVDEDINIEVIKSDSLEQPAKTQLESFDSKADDFDPVKVLEWKDGIGTLPGSRLKFRMNEFGLMEMVEDEDYEKMLLNKGAVTADSGGADHKPDKFNIAAKAVSNEKDGTDKEMAKENNAGETEDNLSGTSWLNKLSKESLLQLLQQVGAPCIPLDGTLDELRACAREAAQPETAHHTPQIDGQNKEIVKQKQSGSRGASASSRDDIYCCESCGCYGLSSEFVSTLFCSHTCATSYATKQEQQSKKEREVLQLRLRRRKKRLLHLMKQQQLALQKHLRPPPAGAAAATTTSAQPLLQPTAATATCNVKASCSVEEETVSSDTGQRVPWLVGKSGFSWTKYLDSCKAKASPTKLFKDPFPYQKNGFKAGMKMEGIDPQHPSVFCVLTVVDVQGYRMRLHFDGYPVAHDFWVNADSMDIFPAGWCEKNNHKLQPPKTIHANTFNWGSYLKLCRAQAAPRNLFANKTGSSICPNAFRLGMKLEAVDRQNVSVVRVATVANLLDSRILVHFDNLDKKHDYWADPSSPYVHPVGWCRDNKRVLTPPPVYNKAEQFSWEQYLKETKAVPAPARAFKQRPACGFRPDMRLECVDPRVPSLIRVATVRDVKGHQIKIQFDGWHKRYCFWMDDDSPDIHPVGWCHKTGHPLEPPPFPEEKEKDPELSCVTPGCRGVGHVKGLKFPSHNTVSTCPYAPQNMSTVDHIPDRLSGKVDASEEKNETHIEISRPVELRKPPGRPPKWRRVDVDDMKQEVLEINGVEYYEIDLDLKRKNAADQKKKEDIGQKKKDDPCQKKKEDPGQKKEIGHKIKEDPGHKIKLKEDPGMKIKEEPELKIKEEPELKIKEESEQKIREEPDKKRRRICDDSVCQVPSKVEILQKELEQSILHPGYEVNANKTTPFLWAKHSLFLTNYVYSAQSADNPAAWTKEDVARFVASIPGCENKANVFIAQHIDGEAFLMMAQSDLIRIVGLKLGPAIKVYNSIVLLRQKTGRS